MNEQGWKDKRERERQERTRLMIELDARRKAQRVDAAVVFAFVERGPKLYDEPTFKCGRCRDTAYLVGDVKVWRGAKYDCVRPCPYCPMGIAVLTAPERPRTFVKPDKPPAPPAGFKPVGAGILPFKTPTP